MKTTLSQNRRRLRVVPPRAALLAALYSLCSSGPAAVQAQVPPAAPSAPASPTPSIRPPSSSDRTPAADKPIGPPRLEITPQGHYRVEQGHIIHLQGGIMLTYQGATLSADRLDGDIDRELIFSGHARIIRDGVHADADAIHLYTQDGRFRLENPRGVIDPSLLEGRVYDPVFLSGGALLGDQSGYGVAEQFIATTCREHFHHYELHVGSAELIPHKRLILRRVGVYLFGVKLITLPTLIVPLDQRPERRPRTDYLPEFGQNIDEGYFARFPYTFAEGGDAGTFVRADITQKRGLGYRVEQEYLAGKQPSRYDTSGYGYGGGLTQSSGAYSGAYGYGTLGARLPRLGTGISPQNGGLFSIQGYLADGFDRNFNAAFRHQQSIGGSNRFALDTELQRNSFFALDASTTSSTTYTSRFDFTHDDATHGVNDALNLTLNNSNQTNYSSSSLSGSLKQSYQFGVSGSTRNTLSLDLDLAHQLNTSSGAGFSNISRSEHLDTQFDLHHDAREYTIALDANRSIPIGFQTGGSNFGTLEKLPELLTSINTYSYRGGWLRSIPSTLQFGVGEYSEPSTQTKTDRVLLGLNLQQFSILRGNTELVAAGGLEQHFYGDGAADYLLHDTADLRQHLGGRSGIDFHYRYDRPEGGTPFQFDQFQRSHSLTVEGGYLNDARFQFTAQTGYDLLGATPNPWQLLATRLMWHPAPGFRYDGTQSYDIGTGRFFNLTNQFRFRGPNDLGVDLVAMVDPNQPGIRRKFTQLNTQFDLPIGRTWRMSGLFRFNGLSGILESRNVQLVHDWDCMEASFTYTENINSFRPDRQFYFAIRLKAFPFSRAFNRGPAGETIGVGANGIY